MYSQWKLDSFQLYPIEYGGHGFRYREPMARNMDELVKDVICQIENIESRDIFLFGHSMGGLIAWLVAQQMKKKTKALFVSACEPPGCIDVGGYRKYQNEDVLAQYIMAYGRLSERRRNSTIFREILLPVIRNDFRLLSEYVYEPCAPLDTPLVVFYSKEDALMQHRKMEKWKEYGGIVRFKQLEGNHFYLEEEKNRRHILTVMEKVMVDA